jgi:hypothetical protein
MRTVESTRIVSGSSLRGGCELLEELHRWIAAADDTVGLCLIKKHRREVREINLLLVESIMVTLNPDLEKLWLEQSLAINCAIVYPTTDSSYFPRGLTQFTWQLMLPYLNEYLNENPL